MVVLVHSPIWYLYLSDYWAYYIIILSRTSSKHVDNTKKSSKLLETVNISDLQFASCICPWYIETRPGDLVVPDPFLRFFRCFFGPYLTILDRFGPFCFWTCKFWPVYLDLSTWTCHFWHILLDLSLWARLFGFVLGPVYLNLPIWTCLFDPFI